MVYRLSGSHFISIFTKGVFMRKFIIGIIAAYTFFMGTAAVNAAVTTKTAVKKIVNRASNVLWRNKGTVAGGVVLATAVSNPVPFANGITTLLWGVGHTVIQTGIKFPFYCLLGIVCVIGIRYFWRYVNFRRILPLLLLGVLFCGCGIAEAGVMTNLPVVAVRPLWWEALGWLFIIITTVFL
jgi:hypothetical protein